MPVMAPITDKQRELARHAARIVFHRSRPASVAASVQVACAAAMIRVRLDDVVDPAETWTEAWDRWRPKMGDWVETVAGWEETPPERAAAMRTCLAWADRTHHDEVERVLWADFGDLSAIASIASVVDERNALKAALAERFAVEEEQRKALNDPSMDAGAVGARDMRSRLTCQSLLGEKP